MVFNSKEIIREYFTSEEKVNIGKAIILFIKSTGLTAMLDLKIKLFRQVLSFGLPCLN